MPGQPVRYYDEDGVPQDGLVVEVDGKPTWVSLSETDDEMANDDAL